MRVPLPQRRPLRIAALAGLVLAFVLVTTGIIAALFPARAAASSSSLEILDGIVALSHDGTAFTEGHDGDLVQQGDVVRTGSESHAVLTFFDGSTIEVEPDTELIVNTLQATSAGDIVMTMQQNFGRSWHVVSRALTPNSKYEVRTPTATATVRGTAFLVSVEPTGRTNLQTTDGVVHAIAGGFEVEVPPGFETNVDPGGTPPDLPTPTPPPPAVVRIVVDATPNAVVVDASKRTVGLLNGIPVRYVPGSTIQLIDGKLVITIPNPTLGRLDTHVQPANSTDTSVEVNVQVVVGGAVVGNVLEKRTIDANGVAKGGVVITTAGTFVVPDSDARNSEQPRIGRIPPPPGGGFGIPFIELRTPAPTPIVTAAPDFIPRFIFDPRLVAATTPTPAPPSAAPSAVFNGGFQPFIEPTKVATSSATPAPNIGLIVFTTTVPLELAKLTAATPTPTPTLTTRLIAPIVISTPTPTPDATLILRTIVPSILFATATPEPIIPKLDPSIPLILVTSTPAPTIPTGILRSLDPSIFATATPAPTFLITRTLNPIIFATAAPPLPTDPPVLQTITPIPILLPTPTPTPTAPPVLQTITPIPILLPTPTPTPTAPPVLRTIAPIVPTFQIFLPTATPAPTPTAPPVLRSFTPRCIPEITCP